jgi:hypothetical protein
LLGLGCGRVALVPIELIFEGDEPGGRQKVLLKSVIEVGFPRRGYVTATLVYSKGAPPGKRYVAKVAEQRLRATGPATGISRELVGDVTEKVQSLIETAEGNLYFHPCVDD